MHPLPIARGSWIGPLASLTPGPEVSGPRSGKGLCVRVRALWQKIPAEEGQGVQGPCEDPHWGERSHLQHLWQLILLKEAVAKAWEEKTSASYCQESQANPDQPRLGASDHSSDETNSILKKGSHDSWKFISPCNLRPSSIDWLWSGCQFSTS